jgi:tRNA1(Val) A37 N6-methylase TrmN6
VTTLKSLNADMETSEDIFLSGEVRLIQPRKGYHRSGSDAVFLASVVEQGTGLTLDFGAGSGAAGLCVAARCPDYKIHLIERDETLLSCAKQSLHNNPALSNRIKLIQTDLYAPEAQRVKDGLERAEADWVIMNPPFYRAKDVRPSPVKERAIAHIMQDNALELWIRAAASALKPFGKLGIIHHGSALIPLVNALHGRFGALKIMGLHPKLDCPASRLLITAIKGRREEAKILPGMVLHHDDGTYTSKAHTILRGEDDLTRDFNL